MSIDHKLKSGELVKASIWTISDLEKYLKRDFKRNEEGLDGNIKHILDRVLKARNYAFIPPRYRLHSPPTKFGIYDVDGSIIS